MSSLVETHAESVHRGASKVTTRFKAVEIELFSMWKDVSTRIFSEAQKRKQATLLLEREASQWNVDCARTITCFAGTK